jgi:uncharacterized protein YbaR (Trm112 family)
VYSAAFGAQWGEASGVFVVAQLAPWFLERLACPLSKAPVVQVGEWLYSTDSETRRRYPIRDGIPNMLADEAETVEPDEFERVVGSARNGTDAANRPTEAVSDAGR